MGGIFTQELDQINSFNHRAHFALTPGNFEDGAGIIGEVFLLSHRIWLNANVRSGCNSPL